MVIKPGLMRLLIMTLVLAAAGCRESGAPRGEARLASGEELFQQHCATCHAAGGNPLYPQKSLRRSVLAANGIVTADDVIAKMRRPGPGMKRFDASELSGAEARRIAEYVLATFK